jgi:hypothetical protein
MLLGELESAARVRILVAAATLHKKRRHAGVGTFEILLGVAGVVAAELIERERGVWQA